MLLLLKGMDRLFLEFLWLRGRLGKWLVLMVPAFME